MHAIRQRTFGQPDVLSHEQLPDLSPGRGQVRIAVRAAGVHFIDTAVRSGADDGPFPLPDLPFIPGREVAGVVDEVGEGADGAWLGRRVVAHLGASNGGYAEQAVVAVDRLHTIPSELSFATAVAAIGTGRTALGILDQVELGRDDVVLVMSAAGGLGLLLVQGARHRGATVVGAAGGRVKMQIAKDHGADLVVDYRLDGWDHAVRRELGERPVTVVLDGVGGQEGHRAFDLLGPAGRLVQFGWTSGERGRYERAGVDVLMALGPQMFARDGGIRSLEREALERSADGTLVPVVGAVFALRDAVAAHRALARRETYGKVVLVPDAS